jgi:hypothetical protein
MNRAFVVATAAIAAVCLASAANAKSKVVTPPAEEAEEATSFMSEVMDCSRFYNVYRQHGFKWGVGPGAGAGFGMMEGALPRYPVNEFPGWYGQCVHWGHSSTAGHAPY